MLFLSRLFALPGLSRECKDCSWLRLSKHLFATLALITAHSIYVGQLVQALAAPLVMRLICMRALSRGVTYMRYYPHPARVLCRAVSHFV